MSATTPDQWLENRLLEWGAGARHNTRAVLDAYPAIADDLLVAVRAGKIDGGTYYVMDDDGQCGCLFAWTVRLAELTVAPYRLGDRLGLERARPRSDYDDFFPIEQLLFNVTVGDTVETNPIMAALERWILEWITDHDTAVYG